MARKKSIEIELDLQDRDAKRALQAMARETGKVEDGFEEAESAGKRMARAIERSADDMIDEIDDTKRAVDALDRALDGTDIDSREMVADLKSVGLTAQDIEADADDLAAALKRSGDVKMHATQQGFDNVGQAVGSVRDETGRATDTMHGFVGGAVGELPLIGDAMGPVAEGLGQLTEGALAGEISMRDMAKVVGPMAGITAGVMLLQKGLESVADSKAFKSEQIEAFKDAQDAVADLNGQVSAFNEYLREQAALEARTGGIAGFFEGTEDIEDDIRNAGVSWDELTEAVETGGDALELVEDKMRAHIAALEAERDALDINTPEFYAAATAVTNAEQALGGLIDTSENWAESAEDNAERQEWIAASVADTTDSIEEQEQALDDHVDAVEAEIAALEEAADAQRDRMEAHLEGAQVVYDLTEAEWAMHDAVVAALEVYDDAESSARDMAEADMSVAQAAQAVADAEVERARQVARSSGATMSAATEVDTMNRSLLEQASVLSGRARRSIVDHIALVNNIPEQKVSEISAALNRGDIDEAERLLGAASRTRTAAINAVADTFWANYALDLAARNRTAYIRTQRIGAHPSSIYNSARGTPYSPGGATLVGEEGPEVVDMPMGAAVTDAQASKGRMARMGERSAAPARPNVVNNITQHFPAGARPADVVDAQRRYNRRQGTDA